MSDNRTRIQALRRKAGDPGVTPEEKDALLAKARELEAKYGTASPPPRAPSSPLWTQDDTPGHAFFWMGGQAGKTHPQGYLFTMPGSLFVIYTGKASGFGVDGLVGEYGWQAPDDW